MRAAPPQVAQRGLHVGHEVADSIQLRKRAGVIRARHVAARAHAVEQAGRRHAYLRVR